MQAKSQEKLDQTDKIIKKGQAASFDGWLVPKDIYKYYRSQNEIVDDLKFEVIQAHADMERKPFISPLMAGMVGVLVGGGLVYVTNPKADNIVAFTGGAIGGALLALTFQ